MCARDSICYIDQVLGVPMDFGMQSFAIGALGPAKYIVEFSGTLILAVFGIICTNLK